MAIAMKPYVAFCLLFTLNLRVSSASKACLENPENANCVALEEAQDPSTIDKLEITFSIMETIPAFYFSQFDYQNVSEIKLRYNRIQYIEKNAFAGLPNLKRLDLRGNNLETIKEGMLSGLESLGELVLSFNLITKIEKGAFKDLLNLEYLNMRNNELSIIPEELQTLPNLRYLDLSHNNLQIIDPIIKSNSLNVLRLKSCNIETLSDYSFYEVPELIFLDISKNNLKSLPVNLLLPLDNIKFLDISENNMYGLDPNMYLPEGMMKIIISKPAGNSTYDDIENEILKRRKAEMEAKDKLFFGLDKSWINILQRTLLFLLLVYLTLMFYILFSNIFKNTGSKQRNYEKVNVISVHKE